MPARVGLLRADIGACQNRALEARTTGLDFLQRIPTVAQHRNRDAARPQRIDRGLRSRQRNDEGRRHLQRQRPESFRVVVARRDAALANEPADRFVDRERAAALLRE
jgi:hypothetical protein